MGSVTTRCLCCGTPAVNVSGYVARTGILVRLHWSSQWQQMTCQGDGKRQGSSASQLESPAPGQERLFRECPGNTGVSAPHAVSDSVGRPKSCTPSPAYKRFLRVFVVNALWNILDLHQSHVKKCFCFQGLPILLH